MTVGRKRRFDKEDVLRKAMMLFWRNGYTGTSISDLTSAMNINKPSLYLAFGNKEQLFNQAIKFYLHEHGQYHASHLFLGGLTTKEKIRNYLISIATMVTDHDLPKGCFVSLTTAELVGDYIPESSSHLIETINQQTKISLEEFFKNEQKDSLKLKGLSPEVLASYIITLQFGLAIAGRNGMALAELTAVIEVSISHLNLG
ncbi:TetR/AcrR family transcriptional regulator [Colwelliaceae bacterium 6441]